jgi:hypothetical protein
MHMHSLLYAMFLFQGKGLQTTYWLDKRLEKPIDTTKGCVTDIKTILNSYFCITMSQFFVFQLSLFIKKVAMNK